MKIEIYLTESTVIIFIGTWGDVGLLIHRGGDNWEYHQAGSFPWDSFHQQVYRNFRAETLTVENLKERGVPLPDIEKYLHKTHCKSWEDNFASEIQFSIVPARLLSKFRQQDGGTIGTHLVLIEDCYETGLGDGKFLYPVAAFWTRSAAMEYIRIRECDEIDPSKRQWYSYSVKEVMVSVDNSRKMLKAALNIGQYEHYSIEDIVCLLAGLKKAF